MSSNKSKNKIEDGVLWLKKHEPNARVVDHDGTMVRVGYPSFVRQYIKKNWIKVTDQNGGTYAEPNYYKENKTNLDIVHSWGFHITVTRFNGSNLSPRPPTAR